MLNIIKADLYRIFRGKAIYITFGLLIAIIILQVTTSSIGTIGISSSATDQLIVDEGVKFTGMVAPFALMQVTDNLIYFMIPIIICVAAADFSSGGIKNVLSCGVSRVKLYFAKLILACLFSVIVVSLNVILPLVVATMINGFGGEFNSAFIFSVLKPFSAQIFMMVATTCIGISIVFITRKTSYVNGVYIAFFMVPTMIIFILMNLSEKLVELFKYDIVVNFRTLVKISQLPSADIIRAFLIGGFYILISTALGLFVFKKCEIK